MNQHDLEQLLRNQPPQQPLSDQHRQLWLSAMTKDVPTTNPVQRAPAVTHPATAVALRALLALAAGALLAILLWPMTSKYPVAQQLPMEPSIEQPGTRETVSQTSLPQLITFQPSLAAFDTLHQQLQTTEQEIDILLQQAQFLDAQQQASNLFAQLKPHSSP